MSQEDKEIKASLFPLLSKAGIPPEDHEDVVSGISGFTTAMVWLMQATEDAKNYITFGLATEEGTKYELTIRRSDGKTPCEMMNELEAENERLREEAGHYDLECPCCGDFAGTELWEDGRALACGCAGNISCDGESDTYANSGEEECPQSAMCKIVNPYDEEIRKLKAENERLRAIVTGKDADLLDKWLAEEGPEAHAVHLAGVQHETELGKMEQRAEAWEKAREATRACLFSKRQALWDEMTKAVEHAKKLSEDLSHE